MKKRVFAIAALAAYGAAAITATKEYVDRKDAAVSNSITTVVSNTVTKAYVGSLGIEAGISAETATNIANSAAASATNALGMSLSADISNSSRAATNYTDQATRLSERQGFTPWTIFREGVDVTSQVPQPYYRPPESEGDTAVWVVYDSHIATDHDEEAEVHAGEDTLSLAWIAYSIPQTEGEESQEVHYTATRSRLPGYILGSQSNKVLAAESDITNTVTKAYVESLGIEAGISAETAGEIATNATRLVPVYGGGERFTAWTILRDGVDVTSQVQQPFYAYGSEVEGNAWHIFTLISDASDPYAAGGADLGPTIESLSWRAQDLGLEVNVTYTATRTENPVVGYTLGDQVDKVLPSTNGLVTASITNGLVTASVTNGLVTAEAATNIASNAISNADTTYRRTIGITNINQSVQYVNITDTAPSTLEIQLPTDGVTKDWMVYVVSVTNVTLSLPAATWWMADIACTNAVPPATPTALWFSQVTDGIFMLGRQELTEVTAP